jgi:hypothetical protein
MSPTAVLVNRYWNLGFGIGFGSVGLIPEAGSTKLSFFFVDLKLAWLAPSVGLLSNFEGIDLDIDRGVVFLMETPASPAAGGGGTSEGVTPGGAIIPPPLAGAGVEAGAGTAVGANVGAP